jgi:formamidopyrimidine-DNA glycosylase
VPELIEIEKYRQLADNAVGRPIAAVIAPDAWFLKGGATAELLADALVGSQFLGTRRIGKLLLLDHDGVLGLRFGMTGRLLVDGRVSIDHLEYASAREEPRWDRFAIRFADGGDLRIRDPRRLGGVLLDPDESQLGIDATALRPRELAAALAGSRAPLKARLMDQGRIAGLGNLLADEILWRAGLDPARPAGSLTPTENRRLHRHVVRTVAELTAKGGSHTGDLQVARMRGGRCPKDGAALERRRVAGRTTYSCPRHQR